MSCFRFPQSALAGLLLFAWPFLSQAQTTPAPTPGLTVTSGMVGVSSTQTARLNVLMLAGSRLHAVFLCRRRRSEAFGPQKPV